MGRLCRLHQTESDPENRRAAVDTIDNDARPVQSQIDENFSKSHLSPLFRGWREIRAARSGGSDDVLEAVPASCQRLQPPSARARSQANIYMDSGAPFLKVLYEALTFLALNSRIYSRRPILAK